MMNDKEKRLLKISLDSFIEDCLKENNYLKMEDITESDLESSLKYFYKDQISMQRSWNTEYNKFSRKLDSDQTPPVKALSYRFLNTIRSLTITSFKWSETIGEKVLAYNPIPGRQVGCVDLQEATGGRAWSP